MRVILPTALQRSSYIHVTYRRKERLRPWLSAIPGAMNAWRMRLETKFLRLKMPVQINSHFGKWQVCRQAGGSRHMVGQECLAAKIPANPCVQKWQARRLP
jgi:hypothetical protein